MEISIFTLQCEFIKDWDTLYMEKFENTKKEERLQFFRMLNQEISNFYYRYINSNIWQFQRAYLFAFWIGTLYIKNADSILEMEKILDFSKIYCPFSKIINMVNSKVRRAILDGDSSEAREIFKMMKKFTNNYFWLELKVNKIIRFYRICKGRKMIGKYSSSIAMLRKRLPDEITLVIIRFLETDNALKISYLQNKKDIDIIFENCGLNIIHLKLVLEVYFKNKQDVFSTIIEIIGMEL